MAVRRKLESVRSCVLKLRPATRGELIKVIQNLKQATPMGDKEIEQFIKILERDQVIEIETTGLVRYREIPTGKTG